MDKYTQLGKITWLWMNSPMHKKWPIDIMTKFIIPAIELKSYVLFEREEVPMAYCSWTYLNIQNEAKYIMNPSKLQLSEWNSGNRLWFLDWIAPFGKEDTVDLKKIISNKFKNSIGRSLRVKESKPIGYVKEYKGINITKVQAQIEFEKLNLELKNYINM